MAKHSEIPNPEEIRNAADALDQSMALNHIVLAMLQQQKDVNKRMFTIIISLIAAIVCLTGGFLWYESQWEYTTTTITQEVDGESDIVNGDQ